MLRHGLLIKVIVCMQQDKYIDNALVRHELLIKVILCMQQD